MREVKELQLWCGLLEDDKPGDLVHTIPAFAGEAGREPSGLHSCFIYQRSNSREKAL